MKNKTDKTAKKIIIVTSVILFTCLFLAGFLLIKQIEKEKNKITEFCKENKLDYGERIGVGYGKCIKEGNNYIQKVPVIKVNGEFKFLMKG